MHTRNCQNFKGEIEFYLKNGQNVFDSKIDSVFQSLKFKTWLCRANIKKQEGYHAAHLLFILFMLPLLQLKTVNSFCRKQWQQWSRCRKDTYYRFKQNTSYRWRTFMNGINHEIFDRLDLHSLPQKDLCFVIDDTILQKKQAEKSKMSPMSMTIILADPYLGFVLLPWDFLQAMHFTPLTMPIFSVTSGMPKPLRKSEIQEAAVASAVMKQSIVPNWSWPCP
jgi:hypothetical protein